MVHQIANDVTFYPRDALHSAVFAVVWCPPVRPSVCLSVCQSCPWVGLSCGLGWVGSGMGRKFAFLVKGWVGSYV